MLGTFLVLIAGGLICQALGWPYIFYIFDRGFTRAHFFLEDSEQSVS